MNHQGQGDPRYQQFPQGQSWPGQMQPPYPPQGQPTPWSGAMPPVSQTGPMQPQPSPFEEPAEAPELWAARSPNLQDRRNDFWNQSGAPQGGQPYGQPPYQQSWQPQNSFNGGQSGAQARTNPPQTGSTPVQQTGQTAANTAQTTKDRPTPEEIRARNMRRAGGCAAVLVVLIAIVVGVVLLINGGSRGKVAQVLVEGNVNISEQEIIRLSTVKIGQNIWDLNHEDIARRIESNRYLRCMLVDVSGETVTLHVKERIPVAVAEAAGRRLVLDNRGFVLEETYEPASSLPHLVHVVGMDVNYASPGRDIMLLNADQLTLYNRVMVDMKVMGQLSLLQELNMSDMDSITLMTREGLRVRLGTEELVHEKLRAFLITRDKLMEMSLGLGTIDVSQPVRPTFLAYEYDQQ